MADQVAAHYASSTRISWTAVFGGWVTVGAAMFVLGAYFETTPLRITGMILFSACLPLLFLTRIRMTDPRPVIVIGPAGYHDRRLGAPIPWAAIRDLRRHRPGRRIVLQIDVADPARYLGNAGAMAGLMQRVNPRMGFPVIGSSLAGLDLPQDRLAAAAEAWWAAGRARD